jgi:hypothetical protein
MFIHDNADSPDIIRGLYMIIMALQIWKNLHITMKIVALLGITVGVTLVIWLAGPLFYSTTVNEEFPTSMPIRATLALAAAATSMPTTPIPTAASVGSTHQATTTPSEANAAPTSTPEADIAPTATSEAAPTSAPEADIAPTATSEVVATEPQALKSGAFTRVDNLHVAEGVATIYHTSDGQLILRLENFKAANGPDLFVSLSGHPMPRSTAEAHESGYREIARLKASQGNQNYELPADLDISQYRSVVIYCRAFSVVFSTAELQ